jgi:hypothetical protein
MQFTSEDDLKTFEGWLKYQGVAESVTSPEDLALWQSMFEEGRERAAAGGKVGLMKLRTVVGEHRYAVVVREGADLWLTLWVRRSPRGEFFIMLPRADRGWNPHTSYHLDGTLHMKSHDRTVLPPQKRQLLTGEFRGSEHLGSYGGYGPKTVGAICDPTVFTGILEVGPGVLGPRDGSILVDLVEPGCEPKDLSWFRAVDRRVFDDISPCVVITVGAFERPSEANS